MSDIFPREIWFQILHRLPLKSLVKCTSVCKAWNSLITDRAFISDHLTHTIQASDRYAPVVLELFTGAEDSPGHYVTDEFYSLYSDNEEIDRLSVLRFPLCRRIDRWWDSTVVGTCNGLVCFAQYSVLDEATQIIWNPSIRKYVILPKPSATFKNHSRMDERYQVIYGFGFDSRNEDFKLVRMVTLRRQEATPEVEIYSLASGYWRSVTATAPPFLLNKGLWELESTLESTPQMFMNGVLHWVVKCQSNGQIHKFILTFDMSKETFGELQLPHNLQEELFVVSILAGGDSLAVLNISAFKENFSIWVMKEYGDVESWIQVFHCDSIQYGGIWSILALSSSGEIVLRSYNHEIVLLDPMKELLKKLEHRACLTTIVGYHVQSLYLINKEPYVLSY